ncbi:hypothetical protein ACFOLD_01425 [Kocuria carniphila]
MRVPRSVVIRRSFRARPSGSQRRGHICHLDQMMSVRTPPQLPGHR